MTVNEISDTYAEWLKPQVLMIEGKLIRLSAINFAYY